MASRDITLLRPELKAKWDDISAQWKEVYPGAPQPFIDCTYRSNKEQDADYAQGRTKPGSIITFARAGESAHNTLPLSSAFDIGFKNENGSLNWSNKLFKQFGELMMAKYKNVIIWGGNFPYDRTDMPHFELADWKKY